MKQCVDDLACFGGDPAFSEPRFVGAPNQPDLERFYERLRDIFARNWLTNDGVYLRQFEKAIADYLGVEQCIAVSNGTLGLQILMRALGLRGEVIVPSYTFAATAHAVQWEGLKPIFCDIDPATYLLDPDRVEELITPQTAAILGVHLYGQPCDADRLASLAQAHGIELLFDAAHAFGCAAPGGKRVGHLGRAEVFSFHATKFVNSVEGGAIVTNDCALAQQMRLMRNFGFAGEANVVALGINAKMHELSAAMGLTALESMPRFLEINRANYALYARDLERIPGLRLLAYPPDQTNNCQYVIVDVDESASGMERDVLWNLLRAEGVSARRYFYPGCHRMQPYCELYPDAAERLPATERACAGVLTLPTGTTVSTEDVQGISSLIAFAIDRGAEISGRMAEAKVA